MPETGDQISLHEIKVYLLFQHQPEKWFTNAEIGAQLKGVQPRTVRQHTRRLAQQGILDQYNAWPEYRFRLARQGTGSPYLARLMEAVSINMKR